ncbi:MAG: tail fiber domain-containing protein [Thermoanaerobaculia bacterium]
MRHKDRFSLPLVITLTVALLPLVALATEPLHQPIGPAATSATAIEWHPTVEHAAIVLTLQHPDGQVFMETFAAGRNPMLRAEALGRDGAYSYEMRVLPNAPLVKARLAAARASGDERAILRIQREAGLDAIAVQSGSFTVSDGLIVSPDLLEDSARPHSPATNARPPANPAANTFFTDDVSAQGGVCAGLDCTSSESYGLASMKMKENNTRLKFEDTSASAGFATTDWQLSANDVFSGGANKFFVEDLTAVTVPLLIEGGTPSNSLYLDSTGRVGLRTSTPAKDLHITTGSTPTIRLEQSGANARSWDMFGNNFNFVVHDATAVSSPLIIRSGAPTSSFVIDASARIGLGVAFPSFPIDHSSGARLDAGNWINASSREVKQDIRGLDRAAAFDALRSLQPVTFAYKTNPGDTQVGFIAEDVPEIVATADRKGLSSMDVVAVLTKVIQEQQKAIEEMRARLECLEQEQ